MGMIPFQKPVRIRAKIKIEGAPIVFNDNYSLTDPDRAIKTAICNGDREVYLYTHLLETNIDYLNDNTKPLPKRPEELQFAIEHETKAWLRKWSDRQTWRSSSLTIEVLNVISVEHEADIIY